MRAKERIEAEMLAKKKGETIVDGVEAEVGAGTGKGGESGSGR